MYPLILKAPLKDYIWGGQRLKTEYGFETDLERVSEAWVLSCHKDGESVVMNGEHAGKKLSEVIKLWGDAAIGSRASEFSYFPLLIKLIDAHDRLSLQVHPNDEYALRVEGEYGKTEMWYVVDCEPGAELIYGMKKKIDKEEFSRRVRDNTVDEVCNHVKVKKGDVFFIPAGTLHAIGKGILIAEVQQNSNTTYRVSDYGRLGADGKPRPLHIDKAIDVTDTDIMSVPYGPVGKFAKKGGGTLRLLAECDKFTAALLRLDGDFGILNASFSSAVVLSGEATIKWLGGSEHIKKGSSIFVPANTSATVSGKAEILLARV